MYLRTADDRKSLFREVLVLADKSLPPLGSLWLS
jgi:hypothetical protein